MRSCKHLYHFLLSLLRAILTFGRFEHSYNNNYKSYSVAESYLKGLAIALRLNTTEMVVEVLEQVPQDQIHYVVGSLPLHHVTSLLKFLVELVSGFS